MMMAWWCVVVVGVFVLADDDGGTFSKEGTYENPFFFGGGLRDAMMDVSARGRKRRRL